VLSSSLKTEEEEREKEKKEGRREILIEGRRNSVKR